MTVDLKIVGAPLPRVDAADKCTGDAKYIDDYSFPGELHAALVLSPYPHAQILAIDPAPALELDRVVAVLTAKDVPGTNIVGCVFPDQPLLAVDRVRFVGDRIAIVVAEDRATARAAAKAVLVAYRPLPAVFDPNDALAEGAPVLHPGGNLLKHQKVRFGKGREAFDSCDVIIKKEFQVNYQEHAYLETQGCAAVPGIDGMTVLGSMQCPFYVQAGVARILGVDKNRVQVVQTTTGGAFGGKEDYPTEMASVAAVAAHATGRPVKVIFDRHEDFQCSTKRHRMTMRYRIGASRDGTLKALDATILVDAGGYAGLSTVVAERSNSTASGPYRFEHAHVDTLIVYTNNLFGGAFRGFGNPQVTFAIEAMMDLLAAELAMDPVELRRKNLLVEGDMLVTGRKLPPSAPSMRVLDLLLEKSRFREARAEAERANEDTLCRTSRFVRKGVGLALSMYGCALHAGGQHLEGSGALVQVRSDGSVEVNIGGTEMGQGAFTVMAQLAAETLGAPFGKVRLLPSDTRMVPDSGPTVASRTTVMSGNAVRGAALQIRSRLREVAAGMLGCEGTAVEIRDGEYRCGERSVTFAALAAEAFRRKINLFASGWYAPPPKAWDVETGQGDAYVVYSFTGHAAEVEVDLVGGVTRVTKLTAVHDVGRAVNPQMLTGQAQGGMVQGMGWATSENLQVVQGRCLNPGFTDYLIPTAMDVPEMEVHFVEEPYPDGPFGAKGVGEPTLISVPTAVALAIAHACSSLVPPENTSAPVRSAASEKTAAAARIVPDRLPVTPETVLRWIHDRKEDPADPEGGSAPPGVSCRRLSLPLPD